MSSSLPRLAIIGCGAIVEKWHLRALKKMSWTPEFLVDRDETRLTALQKQSNARQTATDFRSVIGKVDAAIVAAPHGMHAEICIPLLENSIDLLVEKPLALSEVECRLIVDVAKANDRVVAVGHMRRFLSGLRWTKSLLDAGKLGRIVRADFREGGPFSWPVASRAIWDKASYGGGVLMDTGAHTLDLLLWWLGDVSIEHYRDDNMGGVEADCEGEVTLREGGVARFELSRTRSLRGTAKIVGENGTIEVDLVTGAVSAEPASLLSEKADSGIAAPKKGEGFMTMYRSQLEEFRDCIVSRREPTCTAVDATKVVSFIERCYRVREAWELPWMTPASSESRDVEEVSQ
jgi:predicted dehydrogenase